MFWVISVQFNLRNTLPKYCTFLLGHPVYTFHTDDFQRRRVSFYQSIVTSPKRPVVHLHFHYIRAVISYLGLSLLLPIFLPIQTLNKVSYTSSKHVSPQFKSTLLSSPDMCMGHRDHHNTYPAAEGVGIC